ncbi:MAG: ankyrin repeat domain-containing protein [Gemmatimonadota bacterium]|nr:ankyrin repeat domain-containing protein [Gemmatimonadota bacterium]
MRTAGLFTLLSLLFISFSIPSLQASSLAQDSLNALLFEALSDGKGMLVRRALESGADPDARDRQGNTPLMYAVSKGRHMVDILLNFGADIYAENGLEETALAVAEKNGMKENAEVLREAYLGERVREFVEAHLADRTLFSGLPEFMALTLLRKVNLDDKLFEFEILEKYPRAGYYPFSETEKMYTCTVKGRLQWPRYSGPFYEGTIRVGVAAGNHGIRALYYYGLDESAEGWTKTHFVNWIQIHMEGDWRRDKILYHRIQDNIFLDMQERLYLLKKDNEGFAVCSDDSVIQSLGKARPNPWIWMANRVLDYHRERRKVRSRFEPHLGSFTVADDQFLSAWCRGEIDDDREDDLVCAVETDSTAWLAVILSSRPDTVFRIASFRGGGFTILSGRNTIYLNYGDKPLLPCIWNGETFENKPVD